MSDESQKEEIKDETHQLQDIEQDELDDDDDEDEFESEDEEEFEVEEVTENQEKNT